MRSRIGMVAAVALVGAVLVAPGARAGWKPGETITPETWGAKVGFAPDLAGAPKKGVVIDAGNWSQYKKFIPDTLGLLISKYKLKLTARDYEHIHPSLGFIEATNAGARKATLIETGSDPRKLGITGHVAGLPFPDPQTGTEIAFNYHFGYFGDDGGYHYGVYWVSASSGVERSEEWRWRYIIRAQYRTDIEPKPVIPELAEKDIQYTSMTWAVAPQDKRGFAALYSRVVEPKDQKGWIYLPPTRRTMAMSFGTRGDAWNSTDLLYEDVRGFMGYPEWMSWKLVKKTTILAPMHADVPSGKAALDKAFDFTNWPHWNPNLKWEPRSVYVVEATPKLADYPYSRMVFYFDAETFYIPFKECYDKKGELWKVLIHAFNDSPDMNTKPPDIGTALVIDLQAEHATAFPSYNVESNVGLDPKQFTLTQLKRMGK